MKKRRIYTFSLSKRQMVNILNSLEVDFKEISEFCRVKLHMGIRKERQFLTKIAVLKHACKPKKRKKKLKAKVSLC